MTTPVYNMTDTWNNGATVFQAILMNVTNGSSAAPVYAAGSRVLVLQNNGVTIFSVDPNGALISGALVAYAAMQAMAFQ